MTGIEGPLLEAAADYARAVRRAESAEANPLQDDGAISAAGELLRAAEVYRQARGGHGRNPPREETPTPPWSELPWTTWQPSNMP